MFLEIVSKRLFDFIVSVFGLIFLSPIILIIALILKINSPGSVFFKQRRVGRKGIPFTIIKFRTMIPNNNGTSVSVLGDQRITELGRILRKFKLDELPELWNIIKGDMSFVGPRPDVQGYADRLTGEQKLVLELRPGITCPATLKYANEEELLASVPDPLKFNDEVIWPDKIRMNLEYYHNHSFSSDIMIILRTLLRW